MVLARDVAAGELTGVAGTWAERGATPDAALAFAEEVDELSGAAAVHVAPSVVVAELSRRLRRAAGTKRTSP